MLYALQHKVHTSEITSINALFGILIRLFFSHYQHNLKSWGNIKPDDPCYPSMTWAKSMLCAFMYENVTFCTKDSYIVFFAYAITDLEIAQNQRCCMYFTQYMFFKIPKLYLQVLLSSWSQTFGPHSINRKCKYVCNKYSIITRKVNNNVPFKTYRFPEC